MRISADTVMTNVSVATRTATAPRSAGVRCMAMDGPTDDDAALMLAYANGDADAFDALYARHRGPLYRFLLNRVGNRASADDLFQETWSRVIAARTRYRREAKFSTWLLQIAHNLVVDRHRRQRPQLNGDEAEAIFEARTAPARDEPERALSEFEQQRRLALALQNLPDEQRTVFLLRMEQELGLEDIAVITGAGRETVKSRLRYALRRIREQLAP